MSGILAIKHILPGKLVVAPLVIQVLQRILKTHLFTSVSLVTITKRRDFVSFVRTFRIPQHPDFGYQ